MTIFSKARTAHCICVESTDTQHLKHHIEFRNTCVCVQDKRILADAVLAAGATALLYRMYS